MTVHRDLPILRQRHAGQLSYERIKHGTLGEIEGIGIVDNGIAVHHHLYFRGLHQHLGQYVERLAQADIVVQDCTFAVAAQSESDIAVVVAVTHGLNDISAHLPNRECVLAHERSGFLRQHQSRVKWHAVGSHEDNGHAVKAHACQIIDDLSLHPVVCLLGNTHRAAEQGYHQDDERSEKRAKYSKFFPINHSTCFYL